MIAGAATRICLTAAALAAAAAAKLPHIFFHLVDDWGHYDVGFRGNPEALTPNMDALVASGVLLDRHYVHKFCSPSRSAFQTGRQPGFVNVLNLAPVFLNPNNTESGFAGVPRSMTGIAEKLSSAGYATHQVGKWDAGSTIPTQQPVGRGYNTSLGYMTHANGYWSDKVGLNCNGTELYDLWDTKAPAHALVNPTGCAQENQTGCVYEDALFADRVLAIIAAHDPATPLFLFWASHGIHSPMEVPDAYLNKFAFINNTGRQHYMAMVNFVDTQVGRVVAALKAKGMWEDTLYASSSDNGGPWGGNANNYPLRGCKFSNWDGGIRVNAYASGGLLPPAVRGTTQTGLVALWDWYATFCGLAGVDPEDERARAAGLPPITSYDLWPLISGSNVTSPRPILLIASTAEPTSGGGKPDTTIFQGIIELPWKLLIGPVTSPNWTSPVFPNNTGPPAQAGVVHHCRDPDGTLFPQGPGCLFDIIADPSETNDLATEKPAVLKRLRALLATHEASCFSPDRGTNQHALACAAALSVGGFVAPFAQ